MARNGGRSTFRLRHWIPPQHGVWAMLLLPYLAGVSLGAHWLHLPLLGVWLAGWLASYWALLGVKTWRFNRVWRQMVVWAGIAGACAVPLFLERPRLLWFTPSFAVLIALNAVCTRLGQERSTGNGIVSVTMAAQMAIIAPVTAGLDGRLGVPAAIATWVYLVGTVLAIKTQIRERGSRVHYVVSVAYHAVALAVMPLALDPWLALPFALFLVRATALPRVRLRVPVIGMLEILCAVSLLVTLVLVY